METGSPIKFSINVPRAADQESMASFTPPGMGELNYVQMLLKGIVDQTLYTSSSPTFAGLTLSGLTASQLVGTSSAKALTSIAPGVSLSLAAGTLNTIQNIRTADSPTFTGLTLGSLAGILKAAAGVVGAATIGTSLSYVAPTLDAIQDIRTSAAPSFGGLTITKATFPVIMGVRTSSATNTQLSVIECKHQTTADMVDDLGAGVAFDIHDSAGVDNTIAGVFGVRAGNDTTGDLWMMTRTTGSQTFPLVIKNTGLINPLTVTSFGLRSADATANFLRLLCGSNLGADRNLTFTTGDAARTVTLNGNPTLNDWFDQAVKQASAPNFTGLLINQGVSGGQLRLNALTETADFRTWNTVDFAYFDTYYSSLGSTYRRYLDIAMIGGQDGSNGGGNIRFITNPNNSSTGVERMRVTYDGYINIPGLTASVPVVTDANKNLVSQTYASFKSSLSIAQADVSGLTTGSSPTFAGATIGSLAGVILGTAGVLSALDYVGWTTPSFDAGNFTASGSMTWTVAAGDVTTYAYTIIGKTMTIVFYISTSTLGGTASNEVRIAVPASKTAAKSVVMTSAVLYNSATTFLGWCRVLVSGAYISIYKSDASNYTLETDGFYVEGQITFEIN